MNKEIKKARKLRRDAIHSKVKESEVTLSFEVNGSKDVEDLITYIRDVWKDYKFKELSLSFSFKGEKEKFIKEFQN